MREFSTPMMQQYSQIRAAYPECMLFFRLGDFYELFLDDAVEGAKILGITLTRRPRGKDCDIPMAGVPFHSAETYIAKLLSAGKKIAICEQVSQPDSTGIVERRVVRIVTPGTVVDQSSIEDKKHNYVASIAIDARTIAIAFADLLTGLVHVCEFANTEHAAVQVGSELLKFAPRECIISLDTYNTPALLQIVTEHYSATVSYFHEWEHIARSAEEYICRHYTLPSLVVLGLSDKKQAQIATATAIAYLNHTQQSVLSHLQHPVIYTRENTVLLDPATLANLEVFAPLQQSSQSQTLLTAIDMTKTASGGRMLRNWLAAPERTIRILEERYDAIEELVHEPAQRAFMQGELRKLYDIERISSRLALGLGTHAAVLNIQESLTVFLELLPRVVMLKSTVFQEWHTLPVEVVKNLVAACAHTITQTYRDDTTEGIIQPGIHTELDRLRDVQATGKSWLTTFEQQERERTGITSLKCRYNQVFGYYIEISHANAALVPSDYTRKQTLVNAERFITPELKRHEEEILASAAAIEKIEQEILQALIERIGAVRNEMRIVASKCAQLDVFCSLAQLAQEERYVRPKLSTRKTISLSQARHPVLSKMYRTEFVPNDVLLDAAQHQMLIITGPNMAGKSVFMRQIAQIVLLAHIGSFVPAAAAEISLVDRIFVRSGAADNIARGLSTFMVEMVEAAHILRQATTESLVIMDEIGRGTSTYDGISIAWAIAEYFVTDPLVRPKVLFATHYHELQELAAAHPNHIQNYQVLVQEHAGRPVFLYTVVQGAASHSFGIAVAELAGLPESVIRNAEHVLATMETRTTTAPKKSHATQTKRRLRDTKRK